jgi:hypothetical protein
MILIVRELLLPASEASDPGDIMSERRATSSRNARATSSESAERARPIGICQGDGSWRGDGQAVMNGKERKAGS